MVNNVENFLSRTVNPASEFNTATVLAGQAVGFIAGHAAVLLKVSSTLNPLAAAAGVGTYKVVSTALCRLCEKMNASINFAAITSAALGVAAGIGVYTVTAIYSDLHLLGINLFVLGAGFVMDAVLRDKRFLGRSSPI